MGPDYWSFLRPLQQPWVLGVLAESPLRDAGPKGLGARPSTNLKRFSKTTLFGGDSEDFGRSLLCTALSLDMNYCQESCQQTRRTWILCTGLNGSHKAESDTLNPMSIFQTALLSWISWVAHMSHCFSLVALAFARTYSQRARLHSPSPDKRPGSYARKDPSLIWNRNKHHHVLINIGPCYGIQSPEGASAQT